MANYKVEDIRNIVFCGHGSSGKTTLVDRMLTATGMVNRLVSVEDGSSVCDFDEEEKQHKYTIEASVVHFDHAGKRFNVIDTPGYPDFIGQTIGAMRGVDTAAIVINAQSGIEVNTRRVFAEAKKAGLGRLIVINKMDSDNIDFSGLLESIKELFGKACVPFNVPLGQGHEFRGVAGTLKPPADTAGALIDPNQISEPLLESIIEVDEAATERYFEGTPPSDEELARLIPKAVSEGALIPIVCVSGKSGAGFQELLDALALCALPPTLVKRTATNPAGETVEIKPDPAGPLAAQVFKTRIDPFVQKLNFIRVYSGTLKKDSTVPVVSVRKGVKIAALMEMQADETSPVDDAGPAQSWPWPRSRNCTPAVAWANSPCRPFLFPRPWSAWPSAPRAGATKANSPALQKICEEDSTFHRDLDAQTKEMVVTGMSELHLQILRERLKRRDKVEIETREPKIPYRETIQANAEGMYRHKKQTGGRGQFGEVHIRMYPFPKDVKPEDFATKARFPQMKDFHYDEENHFMWINSIVGASIPGNFLPAVEKGFKDRIERGVIAGYRVQNVCVDVHFGKHHEVDSSEQAFKTAGSMAFRNVFQQAKPALLEPIVHIEVTVPTANVGDINSDMSGRRGRVLSMDSAGGDLQTVIAEVPLAEVTTYARSLSSITGGRGSYSIELSHYDIVPGNVMQEIIAKSKVKEEEEE